MSTEYKLSYTAADIDKRLGKIDDMVLTVNGIAPDNNGNVSIETGGVSSGSMSSTAKNLLISILRNAVYSSNQSTNITALEEALASSGSGDSGGSSGGSDSGEVETKTYTITKNLTNVTSGNSITVVNEGDSYSCSFQSKDGYLIKSIVVTMGGEIEESQTYEGTEMCMWSTNSVTGDIVITVVAEIASGDSGETAILSSISATYSGGDVAVGTSVSSLTGVVVTAHYSDGTSKTVIGYTLLGTIVEGINNITVSYSGKTTTFTVTGVAESGGGDESMIELSMTMFNTDDARNTFYTDEGSTECTYTVNGGTNATRYISDMIAKVDTTVMITILHGSNNINLIQSAGCVKDEISNDVYYVNKIGYAQVTEYTATYTVKAGYRLGIYNYNGSVPESIIVTTNSPDDWEYEQIVNTNLFDGKYIVGLLKNDSSVNTAQTGARTSDYINCSDLSEIYILRSEHGGTLIQQYYRGYYFYDADKNAISGNTTGITPTDTYEPITVPEGAVYIRVCQATVYYKPAYIGSNKLPNIEEFVDWTTLID